MATILSGDINYFNCPLCLDIYESPVRINCGNNHSFCSKCIYQYSALSSTGFCPVCRQNFNINQSTRDDHLIELLRVNKAVCQGCHSKISLLSFKEHSTNCAEAKIKEFEQVQKMKINAPVNSINRHTFKCPYCSLGNFDTQGLIKHCNEFHGHENIPVVCPVCVSMPWGDPNFKSANFIQHLNIRHRFEYDTYVDYQQDDDAMLRAAIVASIQEK